MAGSRKRAALGRGVNAVFGTAKPSNAITRTIIPIEQIIRWENQPRKKFSEDALKSLAASIKRHGLLQPIVVRPHGEQFQIVAGERRYQACVRAGIEEVEVFIKLTNDKAMLELSLVENMQRENLSPIEEARALAGMIDTLDITQEEAGKRLSLSRTSVTNKLRLLTLPASVQIMVDNGILSEGHGRALLGATDNQATEKLAEEVVKQGLSVRKVEQLVRTFKNQANVGLTDRKKSAPAALPPSLSTLQKTLEANLGVTVKVQPGGDPTNWQGKIVISYNSREELDEVVSQILHKES